MNESTMAGRGVLESAFTLLDALTERDEMGLAQLAAATGLPKTTAHRLLGQLVSEGAVQRRTGRYRLGPRVFQLGQTWQPAGLLRAAATRPLGQLAATTDRGGFSVTVPERGRPMLVAAIGREIDEVFPLRAGVLLPPGSAAQQILAVSDPKLVPPEGYSSRQWQRLVDTARDRDLADHLDTRLGLSCVAAPIRDLDRKVVAALAATTTDPEQIPALVDAVRRSAGLITTNVARLIRSNHLDSF
ncbi:IclR family transcriptional regulator [Nocardia sp. NPDC052566]|uniref:IclR family transcriptional regulator n=1 Tax=Nocardia sp. NPDC052566 TaxID=3364330 RepID=UPI0037C63D3C